MTEGQDLIRRLLGDQRTDELDQFDKSQLASVLEVCGRARSLSEAGRILFSESRARKKTINDADRLRKYLARFGLEWQHIQEVLRG